MNITIKAKRSYDWNLKGLFLNWCKKKERRKQDKETPLTWIYVKNDLIFAKLQNCLFWVEFHWGFRLKCLILCSRRLPLEPRWTMNATLKIALSQGFKGSSPPWLAWAPRWVSSLSLTMLVEILCVLF